MAFKSIAIKDEVSPALAELLKILRTKKPEMMRKVGKIIIKHILQRTNRGVDVNEDVFASYDPFYALFRQSKGKQTKHVDLFFSGAMQKSIISRLTKDSVIVYFRRKTERDKARGLHFGNRNIKHAREFFDIGQAEIDEILELVNKELGRV